MMLPLETDGRTEAEKFSGANKPAILTSESGEAISEFLLSKNKRVKKKNITAHTVKTFFDEFRFMLSGQSEAAKSSRPIQINEPPSAAGNKKIEAR